MQESASVAVARKSSASAPPGDWTSVLAPEACLRRRVATRSHVGRLTAVSCRGPHPVRGEADAAAARGRARAANVACRGLTPRRGEGIRARTPKWRLCWAGGGDSLNHDRSFLGGAPPGKSSGATCGLRRRLVADSQRACDRAVAHPEFPQAFRPVGDPQVDGRVRPVDDRRLDGDGRSGSNSLRPRPPRELDASVST
jgi:hypothetical protein